MRFYPLGRFKFFVSISIVFFLLALSLICGGGFESLEQAPFLKEDIPCEWSNVKKIVAVGDLHGAYEYFVQILKGTKLIDENLRWIGGETHLVQIGDVLDRGDGAKDIFDLAMRLEKEAEKAGGHVHMLIGNHEEMNLANTAFDREGYIMPKQFIDFLPEKDRLSLEKRFSRSAKFRASGNSSSGAAFEEYLQEFIDGARGEWRNPQRIKYLKGLNDHYGDWITSHNVVIKINTIVFVHGGISEPFSIRDLKELNDRYRLEINDLRWAVIRDTIPKIDEYDREIYNVENGPLWYRDLAQPRLNEEEFADDVDRILANLKAEHIVIAHTPQTAVGLAGMRKFEGKAWVIDTGIADYYRSIGGHISALIIDNGKFKIWYPDGSIIEETEKEEAFSKDDLNAFLFYLNLCSPFPKLCYRGGNSIKQGGL